MFTTDYKTRRCSVCSQSVRGVYHGRQDDVQSVQSLYEVFTTEDKTMFSLFTVCTRCLPRTTRRCLVCSQSEVYETRRCLQFTGLQDDVLSVHSLYELFTTDYKTMFSLFTVCTRCLPWTTRRCLVCSQSVRGVYHGIQDGVLSVHSLYEVFTTEDTDDVQYKTIVHSLYEVFTTEDKRCLVCSQSVRSVYHGRQDGVQSVHSLYEVFTTEDKTMFSLFTVCTRCLPRNTRRCSVCSQSVRGVYHGRYKTMFSLFTVCTRCLPRKTRRCLVCSQSVRGVYHGRQDGVQSVHSLYEVLTTEEQTMFCLYEVTECDRKLSLDGNKCVSVLVESWSECKI